MVLTGAVNAGTIAAKIRLDSTLEADSRKARKSLSTVAGALTGVAVAAGAAALALSATIGKEVIKAGSDVEEMMGKFDAVFRENAESVEEWADSFGDDVGRSKFELMGFASTLQDTFVPMGFARDEGAELSKQLTELAIDLASFNNEAEPETIASLQSALVGNHETMRKYGVIITQATLGQELMNMGIADGVRSATEQQKVQARMNIIMAGTTDAQGDAERTAGSLANMQRRLKSTMSEMMGEAGRDELPEMVKVLEDFDAWGQAGGYENMQGFFSDVAAGTTAAAKGASAFGKAMTTIYSEFTDSIEEDIDELKVAQAGWAQQMLDSDAVLDEETRALLESRVAYLDTRNAVEELTASEEEFADSSKSAADSVIEDAKAVQAAFRDVEIPGWAGQTEYIKAELERTGARNISELQEVYKLGAPAVAPAQIAPVTRATTPTATTGTGSSISVLMDINAGIVKSNMLSEGIISAIQEIVMPTPMIRPSFAPRRDVAEDIATEDIKVGITYAKGYST